MIERPSRLQRIFVPGALWRMPSEGVGNKCVWLTFDDGPVPEVTPFVLSLLAERGIKATFFMVGDNVRRNPGLFDRIRAEGHSWGNHTMHHLKGFGCSTSDYLADVAEAHALIGSPLFRPPHGLLRRSQAHALAMTHRMVMYDLVTRDYSRRLTSAHVVANVRRYARPGSIIVFHDSVKAFPRLREALPVSIDWLISQGYEFRTIPMQL